MECLVYCLLFFTALFTLLLCDYAAQSLVLTLYGPFDEDSYTYPMCIAQEVDDASFAYNSFYAYYEDGAHVRDKCYTQLILAVFVAGF